MSDGEGLVVIVPSRGRPAAAHDLAKTFKQTCGLRTELVFAIDDDDPERPGYEGLDTLAGPNTTMVEALNRAAAEVLARPRPPMAIAFMGDDHRPRTAGWDLDYLTALRSLPGFVYGDDLVQGVRLPTQVAISTTVVRALGHMAPPTLRHMYVDNYWLRLGQAAGCITYLRNVVVEHLHPVAGTAAWDAGYRRVNAREVYDQDRKAFEAYMAANGHRETLAVLQAAAAVPK
ncbi:hypothetical protein DP939_02555 [Spongiactinospora rosea]|uniref:Glycosyltransferase n=1 Tax=Spongiactinospora rosea TaxID=2248750 RepID=A0A366M7A0_9ACTN|nr:hypothetical protein [Spongiactinospora rosea]RBQ21610.1 hypothetical protein DP939_02555 [Spongiactinospora rosea]